MDRTGRRGGAEEGVVLERCIRRVGWGRLQPCAARVACMHATHLFLTMRGVCVDKIFDLIAECCLGAGIRAVALFRGREERRE